MFPDLTRDDVFRLETRRLWLRWPRAADVTALVQLAGDKVLAEMTGVMPHPYSPADGTGDVLKARAGNAEGQSLALAITARAKPGTLIGMVGISAEPGSAPSIVYWLGTPHWGQGFATEAARALIDAYFAYTPARDLTAWVRVTNPESRRVLEKCGFAAAGSSLKGFPARGGLLPGDDFVLDRRKWKSLKSWSASGYVPHGPEEALATPG